VHSAAAEVVIRKPFAALDAFFPPSTMFNLFARFCYE
jgi:hypothetical protein